MAHHIDLKFETPTRGGFYIFEGGKQLAELEFHLEGHQLNAYHTGVRKELEGQGIAGELFNALVKYARDNHHSVIPTCSYILAKFRRDPQGFADIWQQSGDEPSGESCGVRPK